ncbi:twin-arginine translocation pathway signal [Mycobacterium sp. E802]|uniref:twin-arginine translocation pathway signal n=1 Tax=Mycobacterium sp. E802 TaxID=1834152 RepID=UPI00350FD7E7
MDEDTRVTDESPTAKFEDERDTVEEAAQSADEIGADEAETKGEPAESGGRSGGALQALKRRTVPLALGVALIASAALALVSYFTMYKPDQQTGTKAADAVVQAASDGTVALLSYAPDTLDQDFTKAKTHLTGDFRSYYTDFTTKIVTPAAQQKKVTTTAKVVQGAAIEVKPESAVVLLFINQTTTSQELPDGSFAVSAVKVGMNKIDGNWLISSFDPV